MFGLGFNWLRIGSSGGLVCTVMNHQVPSSLVIYWPTENLSPFLEGICSVELVIHVWGLIFQCVTDESILIGRAISCNPDFVCYVFLVSVTIFLSQFKILVTVFMWDIRTPLQL